MEWEYENRSGLTGSGGGWTEHLLNLSYYESGEEAAEGTEGWNYTYIYVTAPIISFCLIFVSVNLVVLGSLFWVRGSVSPTLQISISLAVSDLITLAMDGLSLTLNSLLPVGFAVNQEILSVCSRLLLEAARLGCRFTTLGHLLALAGTHYLGITLPLQYPSRIKGRRIGLVAFFLWVVPTLSFVLYFSLLENDGFATPGCGYRFMRTWDFRSVISSLFFGSIIIMTMIYGHIYLLVQRSQALRNKFRRTGSTYCRNHQGCLSGEVREESRQQGRRNEKALYTTLLIVGSTVVGWLPASLTFLLVCDDCYYQRFGSQFWMITVNAASNTLLILKTAMNTYIYAARMSEIRAAMKKMRLSMKGVCCKAGSRDVYSLSEQVPSRTPSHRRSQRTVNIRFKSLQRNSSNTTTPL